MILISLRLGSNDIAKASIFYNSTFQALGLDQYSAVLSETTALYRLPGGIAFMLATPRNGEAASNGNGDTIVLAAESAAMVDRWHAAGLAAGGTCEGAPGTRDQAGGRYGAYLRDPDGHKLGVYAM